MWSFIEQSKNYCESATTPNNYYIRKLLPNSSGIALKMGPSLKKKLSLLSSVSVGKWRSIKNVFFLKHLCLQFLTYINTLYSSLLVPLVLPRTLSPEQAHKQVLRAHFYRLFNRNLYNRLESLWWSVMWPLVIGSALPQGLLCTPYIWSALSRQNLPFRLTPSSTTQPPWGF